MAGRAVPGIRAREGEQQMDPVTVPTTASAGRGGAAATAAWLRAKSRREQTALRSRRYYLHDLPSGSRVVDLGEHTLVVKVGERAADARKDRNAVR
jgi:hypothetical protein